MSRRATRELTWEFVLRTFKRVDMIQARYGDEAIAKAFVERGVDLPCSAAFLSDVWEAMRDLKKKAGGDIYAHPNGDCPQCGKDIGRDHNGARYCSTRCRQRAWRERKAKAEGRNSPIPKRVRPQTIALAGGVFELHLKKPPRDVSNSASAQRNVPETTLEDTSPSAESETNVTPGGVTVGASDDGPDL
jgi:hypothetical protein